MQQTGDPEGLLVSGSSPLGLFLRFTLPDSCDLVARHRVQIPEILDTVFQMSTTADLYASTRVCRSWIDLALDRLWEDRLDSVFPLLHILNRLTRVQGRWVRATFFLSIKDLTQSTYV